MKKPLNMKRFILFWTVVLLLLDLAAGLLLSALGLQLRFWLRNLLNFLITLGTVCGVWQLIMRIPVNWLKALTALLWSAALLIGGFLWLLAPETRSDRTVQRDGVIYAGEEITFSFLIAYEMSLHLYESHGPFVCGKKCLLTECYGDEIITDEELYAGTVKPDYIIDQNGEHMDYETWYEQTHRDSVSSHALPDRLPHPRPAG